MIVNVKGRNIEIADEFVKKYEETFSECIDEKYIYLAISVPNKDSNIEKNINTLSVKEINEIVNNFLIRDLEDIED